MDDRLMRQAESLLKQADQAIDPSANGLFDREDLVLLVSRFSAFTREMLGDTCQVEQRKGELAKRLHRSALTHDEQPGISPPN